MAYNCVVTGVVLFLFYSFDFSYAANGRACQYVPSAKKIQEWQEEFRCRDLEVGEVRHAYNDYTTLPTGYTLTKITQNEYKVDIPIKVSSSFYRDFAREFVGFSPDKIEQEMQNKIKSCVEELQDSLKGPNGEMLRLNPTFNTDLSVMDIGIGHSVTIVNENIRHTSKVYGTNIQCTVVIHELLHLTGLVDEYQETYYPLGCRVLGSEDSVMGEHFRAFDRIGKSDAATGPRYKISGTICRAANHCFYESIFIIDKAEMNSARAEKLLIEEQKRISATVYDRNGKAKNYDKLGNEIKIDKAGKEIRKIEDLKISNISFEAFVGSRNAGKTVLEPAHFRAIVYPGCQKKNALYYKCAQFAYKQSCAFQPPECLHTDWLK